MNPTTKSDFVTRELVIDDYDAVGALWKRSEGVEVAEGDAREDVSAYLVRNPRLSRIALIDGKVVGAVLCGHDGRRGLIYHLAVSTDHRGKGIARQLVKECLVGLSACRIKRALILVAKDNLPGRDFWVSQGFDEISGAAAFGIDVV